MTFSSTLLAQTVNDPVIIANIEAIYSREAKGTLEERKKKHPLPETNEVRELITYYISYFVYDNEFMHLIAKEEMLREAIQVIREPITTEDEDKRLKIMDLKGKADQLCDKLVEDIKKMTKALYGEYEEQGKKVIRKAISPEERINGLKK